MLCIFARIFWGARVTLVKQPPGRGGLAYLARDSGNNRITDFHIEKFSIRRLSNVTYQLLKFFFFFAEGNDHTNTSPDDDHNELTLTRDVPGKSMARWVQIQIEPVPKVIASGSSSVPRGCPGEGIFIVIQECLAAVIQALDWIGFV